MVDDKDGVDGSEIAGALGYLEAGILAVIHNSNPQTKGRCFVYNTELCAGKGQVQGAVVSAADQAQGQ